MAGGIKGRRGGAVIHGESRSKEHRAWVEMKRRCSSRPHYVKRGIKVCERWRESFLCFLADVGRAPSSTHTLDRFPNPAGNYEPGNVRWATMLEQRHNRAPGALIGRPWAGVRRRIPRNTDGTFARKRQRGDYERSM